MKSFNSIGIFIMGILSLSMVSCDEIMNSIKPQEENYVTVNIGFSGEYITIADSPLETRADYKSDIYGIQVYTVTGGMASTPYANGVFTSLDNLSIKLLEGATYKFVASILVDGDVYDKGDGYTHTDLGLVKTEFEYSTSTELYGLSSVNNGYEKVRFYGELNNYIPDENRVVNIDTKRTVYGAHFIAEDLTEGQLEIRVSRGYMSTLYTKVLTTESPEYDGIYSFTSQSEAWRGIMDMSNPNVYLNYYTTKQLNISWIKADGSVTPLGTYDVTFKRNVKTTIRIKVADAGVPSGIMLTRESAVMVDDDKEYVIEGGKVTEVPVVETK